MKEKRVIKEQLKNEILICDGAMGTYYARLKMDDNAISEVANFMEPDTVKQIHLSYIEAGAKVIRTNTFAANRYSLNLTEAERTRMIRAACAIAHTAVTESEKEVLIAGSIGPIPENALLSEEVMIEEYKQMIDLLLENDVDLLIFETFPDLYYIKQLLSYIREKSSVYVLVNFCLNKNGYTKTGVSAKRLLDEINDILEVDGCGFNCGIGSGHMKSIVEKIIFPEGKEIAILPNAGYPEQMQDRMVFRDNAEYFKDNMMAIKECGCNLIGGCCGTTPEYIKKIAESLQVSKPVERKHHNAKEQSNTEKMPTVKNPFLEALKSDRKVIAVELDPPYDAEYEKLIEQAHVLKREGADLITMADSPMGRSRVDSILMSLKLRSEVEMPVMPHVCCRDKNMIAMRSMLLGGYINGLRNLLVVTGDPVPSDSRTSISSVFDYNSIRLMSFIKEMNEEHFKEDPIYYGGALNYAGSNVEKVIERMEKKIEAGCSYFLTQPVYSDEDIDRLRYLKERVDTKILCGIMPFVSYRNANFVKNEFTGIHVPDEILNRYRMDMTREEAEEVGAQIANELILKMDDFADGYYFMLPFNRVSLMEKIQMNSKLREGCQ